jgi:hypothetical protein
MYSLKLWAHNHVSIKAWVVISNSARCLARSSAYAITNPARTDVCVQSIGGRVNEVVARKCYLGFVDDG